MTSRHNADLDEWDDDDPEEWDAEHNAATVDCPHCGEEIYEDAQRCPQCGSYLSDEDAPPARKPLWLVIGTALSLYIVYRWVVG